MSAEIQVKGLKETVRKLQQLGADGKDLKAAMNRIGTKTVTRARTYAPVSTGALLGSLRAGAAKTTVTIRSGSARVKYAKFVEFGTARMAAKPFMRLASAETAPEAKQELEQELRTILNRVGLT
jgi:HK97 gp10 family phage protein